MKDYFETGRLFYKNLSPYAVSTAVYISRKRIVSLVRFFRKGRRRTSIFSEALAESIQELFREMGYPGKNRG